VYGYTDGRILCLYWANILVCVVLKSGFDTLNQLIPSLNQNINTKISKATTLHKGWLVGQFVSKCVVLQHCVGL